MCGVVGKIDLGREYERSAPARVGARAYDSGRQHSDHLIHRFAVCDRTTCDARTNLNRWIFSFHFLESYAEGLVARMFGLLLLSSPHAR